MTAKAPAVTFTAAQFSALMGAVDERRAQLARATDAARARERHDAALVTVLTAVAAPAALTQVDCGALLIEAAAGGGQRSPFYQLDPAAPPDVTPAASMTARDLAALPMTDFLALGSSQLAAARDSHDAPFYRQAGR